MKGITMPYTEYDNAHDVIKEIEAMPNKTDEILLERKRLQLVIAQTEYNWALADVQLGKEMSQ